MTVAVPVLTLFLGGLLTLYVQHRLAMRERGHQTLAELAEGLAGVDAVLSALMPGGFIGGPEKLWDRLQPMLHNQWEPTRRRLLGASYLTSQAVADSVEACIKATSDLVWDTIAGIGSIQSGSDVDMDIPGLMAKWQAAIGQHRETVEVVRSAATAPPIRLRKIGIPAGEWRSSRKASKGDKAVE